MKKWILIVFISCLILAMVGCPGLYDSKRSVLAHRHYYDAPGQWTQRELDEARRLDRRDILIYELVLGAILVSSVFTLLRLDKNVS